MINTLVTVLMGALVVFLVVVLIPFTTYLLWDYFQYSRKNR